MSDTPETNELRDLFENHEYRANMGDVWDLCESLERKRDEAKKSAQGLADAMVRYAHQRDAYAETLRDLLNFAYEREREYIRERHPELAQEASQP